MCVSARAPRSAASDDESTLVQTRKPTLFSVIVRKSGLEVERRDFSQSSISIGRGARTVKVDLLQGKSAEISKGQQIRIGDYALEVVPAASAVS